LFVYTCDNGWRQNPNKRNRDDDNSKRHPTEMGIRTPIFITHAGGIKPAVDKTTLASNIDIASTILKACDIAVPEEMSRLDLRDRGILQDRNRIFVEVYGHDSDLDMLNDINNGIQARVIIDGWDKLIWRPEYMELYDLKNDPDDQNDLREQNTEKVSALEEFLDLWRKETM